MRAAMLVLLLMLSTLPLSHVGAEDSPTLTCPEMAPLVPGQPTSLTIVQVGLGASSLAFADITDIQITGVANTTEGSTRTWTATLTASLDAPSGHADLTVNLSDGAGTVSSCTIDVWVRSPSALVLGISGDSTLTVNEGVTTQVAVNLTNVGSEPEDVQFHMDTASDWAWGWTLNGVKVEDPNVSINPDELIYIGAWVEVGVVGEDGLPLFGTGPSFTLTASSSFDGQGDAWTFVLAMEEVKRVSVAVQQSTQPVAPGTDERVEVVVTNRGNVPSTVGLSLIALNPDGTTVDGFEPIDRFQRDGWTAALFGALPTVPVQPGASRTIEVGLLAPWVNEGRLDVRLRANIGSATSEVDLVGEIDLRRSFEVSGITTRCADLEVDRSCEIRANVRNTGTFDDTATLEVQLREEAQGIVNMTVLTERLALNHGGNQDIVIAHVRAHPDALAFQSASLEVFLGPEGETLDMVQNLDLRIAPHVEWVFDSVVQEEDARQRVSVTATLRNDGNVVDGLVVSMKASHGMEMGLIPPEGAVLDDDAGPIRSFEVEGLPIGNNITLRAWFDLPAEESVNGTVYVNLSVRSRYVPEQTFQETIVAPYLGVPWQKTSTDGGFDLQGMASHVWGLVQVTWHIVLAVGIATVVLNRALVRRAGQRAERTAMSPDQKPQETVEDWMAGFQTRQEQPVREVSRSVDASAFQEAFRNRSNPSPAPDPAPPTALTEAASIVLDARTSQAASERLDALAANLGAPTHEGSEIDTLLDDLDLE